MARTSVSPDNEAVHDLRDELKDLNKSLKEASKTNSRVSAMLFVLAMIQLLVAMLQFVQSFAFSGNEKMIAWGITMVVIILLSFAFFLNKVFRGKLPH